MSTKQDIDRPCRQIPIREPRDPNIEDESANYIDIDNGDHDKSIKREIASNKYKKFDKRNREYVILWCKVTLFVLAAGTCVASFTVPSLRKERPRGLAMWQWSLLVTVLLGGPLVSKGIVQFILLFLDREFSAKENSIYYIVGLVESAWVVLWFSMILVAWLMVVDQPDYLGMPRNKDDEIMRKFATTFPIVNVTLITLILGSFLWLLKELLLMIAKSSFHIRRFFDRIRTTLMHQYVIGCLCMSPSQSNLDKRQQSYQRQPSSAQEVVLTISAGKNPQGFKKKRLGRSRTFVVDVRCLDDVSEEEVSCWGMKILIDSMRKNPPLTYMENDNERPKEINSEEDAINAANFIFSLVVHDQAPHQSSHIQRADLEEHFPAEKVSEVMKSLLEGADSQKIGKEVLRKWMVKAFKYRHALVRALEANKRVFRTFNRFIDVLLIFFISALWFIMLKVETRKVIFVIGTAIVGSAFIFGDTCRKFLENILFVFWVHPFDIGDCCLIDNTPVIIEEINVLTTTVLTFDNEMKHYPNIILAGQSISNYTRSRHMGDFVEFPLDIDTPAWKIDALKELVKSYIQKNRQYWHLEHYWVMELEEMSKMKMRLHVQHTINYHEFKERQTRKSNLVLVIKDILINKLMLSNKILRKSSSM